jgi:hypothetical protein
MQRAILSPPRCTVKRWRRNDFALLKNARPDMTLIAYDRAPALRATPSSVCRRRKNFREERFSA